MHPIILKIGSFELYAYGAMLFLAFAVGIIWALKEAGSEGINPDHLYEIYHSYYPLPAGFPLCLCFIKLEPAV